MSLSVSNVSSFVSHSSFSQAVVSHSNAGRSIADSSLGSENSILNFTFVPSRLSISSSNETATNFTRNLDKNLSLITEGFSKNFAHSFSMNERSRTHRRTVQHGSRNRDQNRMNDGAQMQFNKVHKVNIPKGFPSRRFQGPIATKLGFNNGGTTTVRPKLSVSGRNSNSTLPHLPVLWTALSLALGVEVRGELIRGLPCITRFNQLFCRSGGVSYPSDKIERFIDDNKSLIRRMYGEFITLSVLSDSLRAGRKRRSYDGLPIPDNEYFDIPKDFSYMDEVFEKNSGNITRSKRQAPPRSRSPGPLPKSDRIDSCRSEEEVATPYWASNSRGKILAIVNTKEFSQIIHQEICTKQTTKRCEGDCGCEQKYKYHRLMSYDPQNDCKGIFMDWFLFPSCCSCRCDPL